MCKREHRTRFNCLASLVSCLVTLTALSAVEFPDDHPALRLYPSPEDWQRRIEEAKRTDGERFAAARADIDLAIRSSVLLAGETPSSFVGEPHGRDRSLLHLSTIFMRDDVDFFVRQARERDADKAPAIEAWYKAHLEELVVDDSPIVRIATADILLNDWNNWSQWEGSEQLKALRAECPQVHRYIACRFADKLNTRDFNGLFLRWLVDPRRPEGIDYVSIGAPLGGGSGNQVLDFLLHATTLPTIENLRVYLVSTASSIQPSEQETAPCRDIWAEYLTSTDPVVRAVAVTQTGEMIRRMRIYSKGSDNSEALQTRIQGIKDTDSDPYVRDRAKDILESIRTAEWRDEP